MSGFVIGVTIATGGQALWGFVPIWIVDAGSKAYGFPIPFAFTAMVFGSLTSFYEYVGESIYNIFKSSNDKDEKLPLVINENSSYENNLDQRSLLNSLNQQQLSNLQSIKSALQQEEHRQNSQLPPVIQINSLDEISIPNAMKMTKQASAINNNQDTTSFFSHPTIHNTSSDSIENNFNLH